VATTNLWVIESRNPDLRAISEVESTKHELKSKSRRVTL
jgi:hypothetical protein